MNNNYSKGGKVSYLGGGSTFSSWLSSIFDGLVDEEEEEDFIPKPDDPNFFEIVGNKGISSTLGMPMNPSGHTNYEIEEDKPIVTKNYNYAPAGAFIGGGQFPPELTEQGGSDYQVPKEYGSDVATPGIEEDILKQRRMESQASRMVPSLDSMARKRLTEEAIKSGDPRPLQQFNEGMTNIIPDQNYGSGMSLNEDLRASLPPRFMGLHTEKIPTGPASYDQMPPRRTADIDIGEGSFGYGQFKRPDDPTFKELIRDGQGNNVLRGDLGSPMDPVNVDKDDPRIGAAEVYSVPTINNEDNKESGNFIQQALSEAGENLSNLVNPEHISNTAKKIKNNLDIDFATWNTNSTNKKIKRTQESINVLNSRLSNPNLDPEERIRIQKLIKSQEASLINFEDKNTSSKIILDRKTYKDAKTLRELGDNEGYKNAIKRITSPSILAEIKADEAKYNAGRDDKPFRPSTAITNQIEEEKRIKDISDQALKDAALEAAGPDDKSFRPTSTTPTPTAEQIAAAEQVYPEDIPKGLLESSKNILKEAWGDLFNPKMLAKAAILYAGARLTGMTGNQALAFAGQAYLNGITTLHNQEQIDDKVKELRATGMYTDASLEIFRLEPKASNLVTKASMKSVKLKGDTKVFHVKQPNGSYKKVIGLKAEFGNGDIGYVQKVGKELQPIDQTSPYIETNLSLVPGTDEFFARRKDLDTDFTNFLSDQDGLFSRPDFQEFVENSEGELSTKAQNIFRSQDAQSGAMRMRLFAEKYGMPPDAVKEIAIVAAYDAAASKNSGAIKDIFGPNSKLMESAFIKTQIGDPDLFTTYRDPKDPSKTKYDKPENIIAALSAVQNAKDLKGDYVLPDDLRQQSLSRFSQKVLAALIDTSDDDTTDKVTWLDWQASFVQENGVFKPKNGKYIISDKQRAKGITRSLAENINQWHDDVGNKKYAGQSEFIKFLWYKANELEYLASKLN